jgi:asparagine synthase (glutamine-hydrolysing)
MCGICGIIDLNGAPVRRQSIEKMADSLWHRGPDDAGYHFEPAVGLGHRRLSIIDLNTGQQPISNEDGSVWVVFNGEIYNYLDLRSRLQSHGHQFRTNSDTEVIVHLYEEVGEQCFSQLRGMFAIALWDRPRRQTILARDRIGKKPLFYSHHDSRLVFGSELKAITAAGEATGEMDITALADYFTFLYIPAPKSIYSEVRKVPAAHYIVFSANGARQQSYWDLRFSEAEDRSEEEWCGAVHQALMEAVRVRLMSEVPLGSFLSGGMDSSAVVACMARSLNRPVAACSVGFDEASYSEVQYAQTVAQHLAADYHQTIIHPNATQIVELLAWHYDEPFGDSSAIPTYYVSKAARERVTVALTGDGGDESFGGYKRYLYDLEDNRVRAMIPPSLRKLARPLGQWYPILENAPRILRGKSFLQRLAQDPMEGYLSRITIDESVRQSLLSSDLKEQLRGYDPLEQFREHYRRPETSDTLSRLQYLDIKTYLTDDICVKLDRASMAVSLEARCPFLDDRLMELAARIPSHLKVRNGSGKYILKKATEAMFPPGFLDRPKQGFGVPIAEWFRSDLREWAHELIFESDDLLNLPYLRLLWNRHQNKTRDHSAILWGVCMFRQWQRTFRYPPEASSGRVNAFTKA